MVDARRGGRTPSVVWVGAGLLLGLVGGALAGLLRAPRQPAGAGR